MPDPTFEMYYGLPFQPPEGQQHGHGGPATGAQADMRIRGRGLGEDKDEDMEDDDSMSDGSVGGASFCSDSLLPDAPDVDVDVGGGGVLNLRGGSGGPGPEGNVVVCSFSGYTACNFHWARGFYAAVDTALVLGERLDVQITVALIRVLPQQWATILELERGTLGSAKSETDLHNRLLAAYTRARRGSTEGALAFFVCHRRNEEALVDLQNKGQAAKTLGTPLNNPEVFHFQKPDHSGTSAAYLWMPRAVSQETASNLYTRWFKTVLRIASGPQQAGDKLGRRSAQPLPGSYAVQVSNISPSFHHESPLPREVWEAIVKRGRQSGSEVKFNLSFTSLEKQAFAQVPGYYPPGPPRATALTTAAVFKLAWDSVPPHDRSSVARMVIKRPGDAGTATFPCKNGSVDDTTTAYANSEGKLRDWLRHKYFFNIVPQWDEYEVSVPMTGPSGGQSTFTFPGNQGWSLTRSHVLAGLAKAGWRFSDDQAGQYVVRIDQRTRGAGDVLQRNRVAWDMELGIGRQCNEMWRDFRAALTVRRVIMVPVPKVDEHGNPALGAPLVSDGRDPIWNRWGCNRQSVNVDTGELVVVESSPTQPQAQGHDHHHDHHDGDKDKTQHGQPAQAQDQDQGILHQGVPQLGAGVDIFQSGKYYREQSFATPLSVQVGDQKPRFPINAPPLEHIRRPRGPDGIESDSMPIVSTQVMTPTEQRTLQQAFFQMRSIALNRAQQCPHKDCSAFFPVGPGNTAAFHAHLDANHVGTHCPFCDDTLFKHWSPADRQRHFVDKHSEFFTAKGDLLREAMLADQTPSKGNVHRREEQYSFCPRCGRDHRLLSSKADRVHHDNACFPGNDATLPAGQYCRRCGQPDHVSVLPGAALDTQHHHQQHHQCAAAAAPAAASDMFCSNCALECHRLPVSYGRRHLLGCKPLASRPDSWCPWCGVDLKSGPRSVRLKHLAACVLKPASGQNPVCTDTGLPLESPRDRKAHLLRHGLSNLGARNRSARITVPPTCPVKGCQADLTSWNAQGLYYHFQSHPENVLEKGGGLKSCPFCTCNFELRGFRTSLEKQQHFDDHIKHRNQRVLADETIGTNPDRESDVVLDAFATLKHDEFDQKAELDLLHAETQQLSETVKRLSTENRKFRDTQCKSHSTCTLLFALPLTLSHPLPPLPNKKDPTEKKERKNPTFPFLLSRSADGTPASSPRAQHRLTPGRKMRKSGKDSVQPCQGNTASCQGLEARARV